MYSNQTAYIQNQEYCKIQMGNTIYNQNNKFHYHASICHSHSYHRLFYKIKNIVCVKMILEVNLEIDKVKKE
jgi:hypothetical protein